MQVGMAYGTIDIFMIFIISSDKGRMMTELLSLPLISRTLKQKQARIEIESKLNEIDDAIKIFSRPRVFIKITNL